MALVLLKQYKHLLQDLCDDTLCLISLLRLFSGHFRLLVALTVASSLKIQENCAVEKFNITYLKGYKVSLYIILIPSLRIDNRHPSIAHLTHGAQPS